jgi:pilus assembly protein CpaB
LSSRRTLILIAAIAIGAIAAYALYNYVGGIEDRANEQAERVEVFKVERDIPKSLTGDAAINQGYIVEARIPREFLPANSVRNIESLVGLVALNDLSANQVLVEGMFVDPQVTLVSNAERLDDDMVTVTIGVDALRGVNGLLAPGDKVNLLVTAPLHDFPEDERPEYIPGPGTPDSPSLAVINNPYVSQARYLYQAVEILFIGRSSTPQPGEAVDATAATTSGTITFQVPPDAVQRIIAAGEIYISLISPNYVPETLPMLDPGEVLPGEDPARLTPYGPDGRE